MKNNDSQPEQDILRNEKIASRQVTLHNATITMNYVLYDQERKYQEVQYKLGSTSSNSSQPEANITPTVVAEVPIVEQPKLTEQSVNQNIAGGYSEAERAAAIQEAQSNLNDAYEAQV
jgi:hypothetical protein